MNKDFSANLGLLCAYHRSIAEVCRKLDCNRQQFNKYLGGQSRPSRNNMRRICDFFGVTEAEILLEADIFEEMIILRRKPMQQEDLSRPLQHLARLHQASQSLEKYLGYYFRYFYSFGNPGYIIRSLVRLYREDDMYFWKNIEILRYQNSGKMSGLNKYEGAVFFLVDRIYVMEYETLQRNSITQVTLYPSHRHRLDRLLGIQTGGPTRRGRKPSASKVALEFIGKDVDLRLAFRQLGLFMPDSPALRRETVELIRNTIAPEAYVLDVEEP